jgi:hypothetical protein
LDNITLYNIYEKTWVTENASVSAIIEQNLSILRRIFLDTPKTTITIAVSI